MPIRVVRAPILLAVATLAVADAQAASPPIDIPSQPLISAIAALARQTRAEILLQAPGMEGRRTHRVRGQISTGDALTRMTRGLNLTVRRLGVGIYVVQPMPPHPRAPVKPEGFRGEVDILVTARRRLEKEDEIPLLVTRQGLDMLNRQAVRTLADLARVTPGFIATGQSSSSTPTLVMRGQRRPTGDENRLPLVVYLDEVPLPNQAALSPLFDIASVEILRGPQGTLFGRNTTGGAVLLSSVIPGSGTPSYVESTIGNYGFTALEGALDVPIAPGVSIRASGQRTRRDGFVRLVSRGDADDAHSDAARLILRIEPAPLMRSTTSFELLNADEKGSAQILAGAYAGGSARTAVNAAYFDCGNPVCDVDAISLAQQALGGRVSQGGVTPLFRRRFRGLSNITEYGDEDLSIRNILGWRSTRMETAYDGDGTPLQLNDSYNLVNLRQWTEELQVQGTIGRMRYIGGAFYLDSAPDGPMLQRAAQFVRPDNPILVIASYQHFKSAALFGQASLPLGRGRTADLGLRYTIETLKGCSLRSTTSAPLSTVACLDNGGSSARSRASRLTWTAALSQRFGDATVYITSRRAFRSGGYNIPALGVALSTFQTFKPETITDVEGGAKGKWQSGAISGYFALAGYVGLYRNIQRGLFPQPDFDGDSNDLNDPITLFVNIARARIAGIDGDLSIDVGPRTGLRLSASYVDARYTKVDAPTELVGLLGDSPLDNRFSYTPRFSVTASLTHDVLLPSTLGTLELGVDYSHSSSIRFAERINDPFATQPAYGLLGASISWRRVGGYPLDVQLWGRNLTDRYYAIGGGTLNPTYTTATLIPGPPRTFGLRVRYVFE
ncbi:TonB-dependent receptor [Sphingobium aquiterrae]|uniref:TonB-dependent receptor n=1 Tax=Sphingobium aquiterrae TaxID=2038656 RepID=UPI0030173BA7